jgi:formylglycine-generating enzyme required for sulfatase activity
VIPLSYRWRADDGEHELRLVPVPGTGGTPYLFGKEPNRRPVEIRDFHMMSVPVTRAFWTHVTGSKGAAQGEPLRPVACVSWDQITAEDGFLDRINKSEVRSAIAGSNRALRFRLPSETEWEYAARGGRRWADGFAFSGSNDIDTVAWYCQRFSSARRLVCRLLGSRLGWRLVSRPRRRKLTHTHDVGMKAANQLGLHDMCGNVWEWCQDTCVDDIQAVPADGAPWLGQGSDRRLRGGCHHNWDLHCTVWFRYGIARDTQGDSIGFRLVLADR